MNVIVVDIYVIEKMIALRQEISKFPIKTNYAKSVYAKEEDLANYVDVSY